jgi:hypothetical protein
MLGNWGEYLVNKVLHPFAVFATPTFILILMVFFVGRAFNSGINNGVRSFAGVILPLIIMTYIFIFQKDLIAILGKINTILSFFISLFWGFLVMVLISILSTSTSGIPIKEIILSGSFSILVFSYVSIRENKMLSFYYGIIAGFLFFIIFFGFPIE